jgi:hypothetical protein
MTKVMSCSIRRTVVPRATICCSSVATCHLAVQPGGGLVEQQQPRLGRERTRNLEETLLAIRQRGRGHLRAAAKAGLLQ